MVLYIIVIYICFFRERILFSSRSGSEPLLGRAGLVGGRPPMADSSSSRAVTAAGLAGCIPGIGQRLFGGHTDPFSWRARVGQILYDKRGGSAADVPAAVEAVTDLEKGLNMYGTVQACVFQSPTNFH